MIFINKKKVMRNLQNQIDRVINKVLNEEITKKAHSMSDRLEGEWIEIDTKEGLHGDQTKLDVAKPKGKLTSADFKKLSKMKKLKEMETEEGNAFTGALSKAKESGKDSFEVDGKKFQVKEEKKWIQKTEMKKGELHKKLGIPEGEKIPVNKLKKLKSELQKKGEGDKKMSESDLKLLKQVNLALNLKDIKESIKLTEDELIDLIETIVTEQKVKDVSEKNNISKKSPEGLKKTEKALDASQKENDDYIEQVTKKMKDYLKDMSKGQYNENPEYFPKGNGELAEMPKKAYKASKAVEEYIENFAYAAGLDELAYDEIEPNEEWVKDNIVGSSRTGNNPKWANAVETELGEKIFKKSQIKPYTTEKRKGSYKRQAQPIDKAGEHKGKESIDDMFAKLESKQEKKEKLVSEEMYKMKNLISYDRKTQ
jgi:hypothetical protein